MTDSERQPRHAEDPLRSVRIGKRDSLEALGIDPYPYSFERTHEAGQLERRYPGLAAGAETEDRVRVAGRIRAMRNSGMFIDLHDASGKVQIFCHKDLLGSEALRMVRLLDIGDLIGSRGSRPTNAARRAYRERDRSYGSREGAAPSTREISWACGYRAALSPALSRPDHEPAEPGHAAFGGAGS